MTKPGSPTAADIAARNAPHIAAEQRRLAKIAAAAAGDVLPETLGVSHPEPFSASVTMDTRTGSPKP